MTKPIKPKALPKELRKWLEGVVTGNCAPQDFEEKDARAILAALAHERLAGRSDATAALQKEAERVIYNQPDGLGARPNFTGDAGLAAAHISREVFAEMDRMTRKDEQ